MYTGRARLTGGRGGGEGGLSQSFSRFPDKRLLANGGEAGGSTGFQIELSFKPRGRYFRRPTPSFRTHEEDTFAYLIRFYSIRAAHAIAAWKRF